jgi:mRNA interferase RelE/StbE
LPNLVRVKKLFGYLSMTYKLEFYEQAFKEWKKLDKNIKEQFKEKLIERLESPRVPAAKLRGSKDRYKIKLRGVGYRLVYEVHDASVVVLVVAVGKRDKNDVYLKAAIRFVSDLSKK